MDALSTDLLAQIFFKLPLNDLQNCSHTCTDWNRLIQSTSFIAAHYRFHQWGLSIDFMVHSTRLDDGESVINLYNNEFHNIPFPPLPEERCRLCCVLNGVVCLSMSLPQSRIILWNPLLGESIQFLYVGGSVSLAREGDDIIVIYVPQYLGDVLQQPPEEFLIRRRNSAQWESVPVDNHLGIYGYNSAAVIDGKPYFNTNINVDYGYVCFDPASMTFNTLSLPKDLNVTATRSLVEIKGKFSLATFHQSIISIYEYNNKEWIRTFESNARPGVQQLLGSTLTGGLVMWLNGVLGIFNPSTGMLTELNVENRNMLHYSKSCSFRVSLLSCRLFGMEG